MVNVKRGRKFVKLVPVVIIIIALFVINAPTILNETEYLDYSTSNIQHAIDLIEFQSNSTYSKIVNTAKYVDTHIVYTSTGPLCISETASSVLDTGAGNCVSSSKLVAAILSGMDIPVVIVDGCVFTQNRESYIEDLRYFSIPSDINSKIPFSLTSKTFLESKGQVHSWVRAYDEGTWYTIETTAGAVFVQEKEEKYGYDVHEVGIDPTNPYELCIMQDQSYVNYCLYG